MGGTEGSVAVLQDRVQRLLIAETALAPRKSGFRPDRRAQYIDANVQPSRMPKNSAIDLSFVARARMCERELHQG